ncbi:MAG: hypothetical protein ACR2LK_08370 [Solirubrobacteraceae bacterium]
MEDLAQFRARRAARAARPERAAVERSRGQARPTLYFDLASPQTYLVAERAERIFPGLRWVAASAPEFTHHTFAAERARLAQRAAALGMPLVWPEDAPVSVPCAMRVAALAVERGLGSQFMLAITRLAFCGAFHIEDPRILCDAAAVAGLSTGETLLAARDGRRDGPIAEAGRRLVDAGAQRLPALELSGRLFCGEERLAEAAAAVRHAS